MKKWLIPTAALAAVLVAAIGTFAIAGGFDDDDDGGGQAQAVDDSAEDGVTDGDSPGSDEAKCAADATDCNDPNDQTGDVDGDAIGMCIEGVVDCVDTVVDGGAAGSCLEGTVDCIDTPGVADCEDTTVECNDTGGSGCTPESWVECEPRMTAVVFADLEQKVPGQEVTIASVEYTEWSDTSLGNPEDGMAYAEVITPGFKIVLEAGGQAYEYHTDLKDSFTIVN